MKKAIILCIELLYLSPIVLAIDNTNIDKVEYKWYKEEITEGIYYPKNITLKDYYEDTSNLSYGNYSDWETNYCNYSKDEYEIEEKTIVTKKDKLKTKYITFSLFYHQGTIDNFKIIKVFQNNKEINYIKKEIDQFNLILKLDKEYESENFSFYIEMDKPWGYFLTLSNDENANKKTMFTTIHEKLVSNYITSNNNWIPKNLIYTVETDGESQEESENVISTVKICRIRQINTYRYKITKKYYDDNYHLYVDGYIPDIKNMNIYYKKDEPNYQKEQTKQLQEYNESDKEIVIPDVKTNTEKSTVQIKTKYINKIIKVIPKKIYLLLLLLLAIIIFQTIYLIKKCRLKYM